MRLPALWLCLLAACQAAAPRLRPGADPAQFRSLRDPVAEALWGEVDALLAAADPAAAIPKLRQLLAQQPQFVPAHVAYQDAAAALGGAAAQEMREFYRAAADLPDAVSGYAQARLLPTAFERDQALQALLAQHPGFAYGHLSRGRIQHAQGRLQAAAEAFLAAIVCDPGLLPARLLRASTLAELGRDAEAALEYEIYLAQQPEDDLVRQIYAQLAIYRLGRVERARQLLAPLLQQRPEDPLLLMDRAALAWLAGDTAAAIDLYLAAVEHAPAPARALLNLGLLYYDVLPRSAADRQRYWPRAALAFELFLAAGEAADGHEAFERAIAVPARLAEIERELGDAPRLRGDWTALRRPPD